MILKQFQGPSVNRYGSPALKIYPLDIMRMICTSIGSFEAGNMNENDIDMDVEAL